MDEETLEQQLNMIEEWFGFEHGEFGAGVIVKVLVEAQEEKGVGKDRHYDDMRIVERTWDKRPKFTLIIGMTERAGDGLSATLSPGPVARLYENGFVICSVDAYDFEGDPDQEHIIQALNQHNFDKYLSVTIQYYGDRDHPLFEYYDE